MSRLRMRSSKFYGLDSKQYWNGLDEVSSVKLLAKMFREITHMKPPRGRQGRLLDQSAHICVEAINDNYTQAPFTAEVEMMMLENKTTDPRLYRAEYRTDEHANENDLLRLQALHKRYEGKKAITNTVGSLQDLVEGLMGLGMKNLSYQEVGYSNKQWQATMSLEGFTIVITKEGGDDDD